MTPTSFEELRARIHRAEIIARRADSVGYQKNQTLADGSKHQYQISGIKSPEQFEDDLLTLFVWVWSLKDYLKELYKSMGLDPRLVEEMANNCTALKYVSDVANKAKHGILQQSRSGQFAELVNVGHSVPQAAISKITFSAFNVEIDVSKADQVLLHAFVKPRGGEPIDAFEVLAQAMLTWETKVIPSTRVQADAASRPL
ncbi:hypothetical protein [Rhodanobacter soli]|uniref:hypothetical protein n=1 Tax=Rhodanobacter soli TaxID=590609 RepID=UPI0031D5AC9A